MDFEDIATELLLKIHTDGILRQGDSVETIEQALREAWNAALDESADKASDWVLECEGTTFGVDNKIRELKVELK